MIMSVMSSLMENMCKQYWDIYSYWDPRTPKDSKTS